MDRAKQNLTVESNMGVEKSEYVNAMRKTSLVENYRYFVRTMQARLTFELAPKYFRKDALLIFGKDESKDQVVALTTDMFDVSLAFA